MSVWCNVCRTFRQGDDLTTDYRGHTTCPECGTRLSTSNGRRATN